MRSSDIAKERWPVTCIHTCAYVCSVFC